jgi:hypothetical protein
MTASTDLPHRGGVLEGRRGECRGERTAALLGIVVVSPFIVGCATLLGGTSETPRTAPSCFHDRYTPAIMPTARR